MKKNKILLVGFMISMFLLSGCAKNTEGIAIQVNKESVSIEAYEREYEVYKDLYERQYGEDALSQEGINGKTIGEELRDTIISKLTAEALIEKDSIDKGIQVSEEEVKENIDKYKESIGGEDKYREFLENNNLTEEYFKENIRKTLLLEKHKEFVKNEFSINEAESIMYFNENSEDIIEIKASHMLFSNEEDANRVKKQLADGESFEDLAKAESLDSVSALNGGDLGYFSRGNMIPEFEDKAFSLDVGETSDVLKTEVGYHIILIKDKKTDYKDLKDKTIDMLKEQKYIEYLRTLRENAKITVYI